MTIFSFIHHQPETIQITIHKTKSELLLSDYFLVCVKGKIKKVRVGIKSSQCLRTSVTVPATTLQCFVSWRVLAIDTYDLSNINDKLLAISSVQHKTSSSAYYIAGFGS